MLHALAKLGHSSTVESDTLRPYRFCFEPDLLLGLALTGKLSGLIGLRLLLGRGGLVEDEVTEGQAQAGLAKGDEVGRGGRMGMGREGDFWWWEGECGEYFEIGGLVAGWEV